MEKQQYGVVYLRGEIRSISPVSYVGEKKTPLQTLTLFVPGYHDGFEKRGRDSHFELQAMGKKVGDLQLSDANYLNKKVVVKCFTDSQYFEPREAGQNGFFAVNFTINEIELWEGGKS